MVFFQIHYWSFHFAPICLRGKNALLEALILKGLKHSSLAPNFAQVEVAPLLQCWYKLAL